LLARSVEAFRAQRPIDEFYTEWLRRYGGPTEHGRAAMREDLALWNTQPVISLIMPVHESREAAGDPHRLDAAIHSVRNQLYPHWELWVEDDSSMTAPAREQILAIAHADSRIRITSCDKSAGEAPDGALARAAGDFIALLDCNDEIAEDALYWIGKELAEHPQVDMIFSDEDRIDLAGRRRDPRFKPDWNPSLMLAHNMFGRLGVFRKRLVEKVGGFGPDFAGSQVAGDKGAAESEHDLVLRCAQATSADRIRHIPRVLYHRGASSCGPKSSAHEARACPQPRQLEYALPAPAPHVSVLVPSACEPRLIEPCLRSLLTHTHYEPFDILLLVNERHRRQPEKSALIDRFAADPRVRVLAYPDRPFNYSSVNNWGAREAEGKLLCFLNDDTSVITPEWLERLAARASLPGVAAAGPMLRYSDDSIQHAGVILGLSGVAGHACHGLPKGDCGYLDRACLEQDVSCLTAACLVMRKDVFLGVGGFDEALPIAFNDVDLCVRLRLAQWRLIWTPAAELYHYESTSVGRHDAPHRAAEFTSAVALMRKRWGPVLDADPYYNPNLSLRRAFHLAFPPRLPKI
jgi:GT2 family glycosyltransferase